MKKDLTEIIAVLDRSGSMESLTEDTIGGYNEFIEKQKALPGEATLSTILFDDRYEILHDRVSIKEAKKLNKKQYYARGQTALLDAMGKAMNHIGQKLYETPEEERPSKVIVLVITDGEENASTEFSNEKIKEMVELQRNVYSWEFLFIGANIDSFAVAGSVGIRNALHYTASERGVHSVYTASFAAVSNYRNTGDIYNGEDFEALIQ